MRQKRKRFEENKQFNHLIEPGKPLYHTIKGKWHSHYFKNNQPITLEIGCGHAAYTIGLAKLFPDKNFIGIDIKGDRLWKGATEAQASGLTHVAFLRIQLAQLQTFFTVDEVAEIWIPFPDPRPKKKDIKRRLTSPRFLYLYSKILKKNGKIHLKTDNIPLFYYTLDLLQTKGIESLAVTTDLYHSPLYAHHFGIQTTYEKRFLARGIPICYMCFTMDTYTH